MNTVLITGSSTGIGRATVEYFQAMGWQVAATMRHPEAEKELTQLERVWCHRLDVEDETSIEAAVKEIIARWKRIDVVVNNAGFGAVGPFEAATPQQIQKQFNVNVFGTMHVIRTVLPHFREKKSGLFINVAAVGGRMAWPLQSLYHGSKWALEGFSESLHYELKPLGIGVKLVEPGATQTDFFGRSQAYIENKTLTDYAAYVNLCMPNLQQLGAFAPGPEQVANTIYRAATDGSSRLRYVSGTDAARWMRLRRWLPASWFSRLVRKQAERQEDRLSRYRKEAE